MRSHKDVFTEYLREGGSRQYDWRDWLVDVRGLEQCEICRKYGDYGSDVVCTPNDGDRFVCEGCMPLAAAESVDAIWETTWDEDISGAFKVIRAVNAQGHERHFARTESYSAEVRALLWLKVAPEYIEWMSYQD